MEHRHADTHDTMVRPELIALDGPARERVSRQIEAKGGHCESCGGRDFAVGDALYLGFLFLDEERDAYMIALTCRNPDCAKPRSGIVLAENDFLAELSGDGNASR